MRHVEGLEFGQPRQAPEVLELVVREVEAPEGVQPGPGRVLGRLGAQVVEGEGEVDQLPEVEQGGGKLPHGVVAEVELHQVEGQRGEGQQLRGPRVGALVEAGAVEKGHEVGRVELVPVEHEARQRAAPQLPRQGGPAQLPRGPVGVLGRRLGGGAEPVSWGEQHPQLPAAAHHLRVEAREVVARQVHLLHRGGGLGAPVWPLVEPLARQAQGAGGHRRRHRELGLPGALRGLGRCLLRLQRVLLHEAGGLLESGLGLLLLAVLEQLRGLVVELARLVRLVHGPLEQWVRGAAVPQVHQKLGQVLLSDAHLARAPAINESLQLGEIPEAVREGAHAVLRHVERSEPPQRTQLFRELGELVVVQENFLEGRCFEERGAVHLLDAIIVHKEAQELG
mmetsp:Transcript_62328/g.140971  ORF Transcript_62328/g.140971 Transcript_62328/m.140971 type:complete len:394 (+) Transcript_62328:540-1721(+)